MDRRTFVATGIGGALGAMTAGIARGTGHAAPVRQDAIRDAFPIMREQVYLNAAGMMPLGDFSVDGLRQYEAFQRLGPQHGRGARLQEVQQHIRRLFADLIGADEAEVGLVHCTKAGEQIAIEAADAGRQGKNIVTNDLHFTGSLHNYVGLQRAGVDVRIVRARDWQVPLDAMTAAIDDRTALVAVSLVSNVNGHVEDLEALAAVAHAHGALVYADIIQAAGIVPLDVHRLGIDVAACSCYKWLYGTYGTGFVYVRQALQGTRLPDRLFPGSARHNYAPWVPTPAPEHGAFRYQARQDATRYQPGHVSYIGYSAVYEGLTFLHDVGVANALAHSVALNRHLLSQIDAARYPCITPDIDRAPIATLLVNDADALSARLQEANVTVSLGANRLRVSPALYNNTDDMDRLAAVLNG